MTNPRPDLAAYLLVALVVIVATIISLTGNTEPSWFEPLAFVAVGGGAGVAIQTRPKPPVE